MKPNYWNKGKLYLSKNDKILKSIINNYPKEHLLINKNYYHCLINSIIGQQISVTAANSIKNRFFSLNKKINPQNVLKIKKLSLVKIGLSKQKINYINNISEFFITNKIFINKIEHYNENEIRDKLIQIKGVGPWTVDMFLIFSIGNSNVFPKGDLGFIKAIATSYKKKIPVSDIFLNRLYKKWSPFNSVATWYLWRSLDPLPINY